MDHVNDLILRAHAEWQADRWSESIALIEQARTIANTHHADESFKATLAQLSCSVLVDELECHVRDGGMIH